MIPDKTESNNPLFGKILTAMVTPFTENGDVDYELAIKLSNYLFENGSDGIVLCLSLIHIWTLPTILRV